MRYKTVDKRLLIRAVLFALLIEVATLPIAMFTMGHAGPEGPWAILGWIGLLINFPGFLISGRLAPFDSQFGFAGCVFSIQMVLFTIGFYLIGIVRKPVEGMVP